MNAQRRLRLFFLAILQPLRSHPSSDDEYITTFSRGEKYFAGTYLITLAALGAATEGTAAGGPAGAGLIVNRLSGISYCAAPWV